MNNVRKISIKNHMYYLFDDLIIIKNLDANNVKINEKLYKNISAYCAGFETGTRV